MPSQITPRSLTHHLLFALRDGVLVLFGVLGASYLLQNVLTPLLTAGQVDQNVTTLLANVLIALLPSGVYVASAARLRELRKRSIALAVLLAVITTFILFLTVTLIQSLAQRGDAATYPSLGFTLIESPEGAVISSVEPGGAAETAGLQIEDVITGLRRDTVTKAELEQIIAEADEGDALRLRFLRNGEEMQLTANVTLLEQTSTTSLLPVLVVAGVISLLALFLPGTWTPHILLSLSLLPLLLGYLWLIVATFSYRTQGIIPVDSGGNFGGWTLENWRFLGGQSATGQGVDIWSITFNSFLIAAVMTVVSITISSMTGYALSRMNFAGRRTFLSLTLILHGFPAVTLIIPIFLVLISLANIPVIGRLVGFNTPGGIALVMVAFELPLGVWLMKGFFDNIPWDMERSALIDGASRWRTFWEIILPQIRPGLLALGIFSFIGGWNAYLIPSTYSIGTGTANLPVYINQLVGEVSPVNWNQVAAVGLFQLLPIFIFFIFAQEYLLNIYAGGTKGNS